MNKIKLLFKHALLCLPLALRGSIMYAGRSLPALLNRCPGNLTWFLTERCNLNCPHCFVFSPKRNLRPEMPACDILRVLSSAGNKIKGIVFTGGEPLLYRDFKLIFDYASRMKSIGSLTISTNALLYAQLLSLLEKVGNKRIHYIVQTSLDGPEAVHNSIRGNSGAYAALMKLISGLKEIQGRVDKPVKIDLVMTVSAKNNLYVQDTALIAKGLNLPIVLNFVRSNKRALLAPGQINDFAPEQESALSIEQMRRAQADWYDIAAQYMDRDYLLLHQIRMENVLKFYQTNQWLFPCAAGIDDAVIFSDGSISLCETKVPIGNIYDAGLDYQRFWRRHWHWQLHRCFCAYDCAMLSSFTKSYSGNKLYYERLKKWIVETGWDTLFPW